MKNWTKGDRVITPRGKTGTVDFVGDHVTIMCDGEDHPCYYNADQLKAVRKQAAPKKAAESKAVVKSKTVAPTAQKGNKATVTKSATAKKTVKIVEPVADAGDTTATGNTTN